MSKLDPRLEARAAKLPPDTKVNVFVHYNGARADVEAAGLTNLAVAEGTVTEPAIAAGSIAAKALPALAAVTGVEWVDPGQGMKPQLHTSIPGIGVHTLHASTNPGRKGEGVLVGVIDMLFNFRHPTFLDDATPPSTRIRYFWDQMLDPATVDPKAVAAAGPFSGPTEFPGMGTEFSRAQLNALRGVEALQMWGGHGTHVAGIAAGSGRSAKPRKTPPLVGVAPEADLILVRPNRPGDSVMAEDVNIARAVDYVFRKAACETLPVVLNMSMGDHMGPHDGTSPLEKMIDRWLAKECGRVMVVSAGNDLRGGLHAQNTVAAGATATVELRIDRGKDKNMVDIWYTAGHRLSIEVEAPTGEKSPVVDPGGTLRWDAEADDQYQDTVVIVHSYEAHPWNGDNRIIVELDAGRAMISGDWKLHLKHVCGPGTIRFDAWSTNVPFVDYCPRTTLTVPATAGSVIAVAAYSTHPDVPEINPKDPNEKIFRELTAKCEGVTPPALPGPDPAAFSAQGPARDGREKPDISAPGVGIVSALGGQPPKSACCTDVEWTAVSGTSQAAPHVAGVAALLLQANPKLWYHEVFEALRSTTDPYDGNKERPRSHDVRWGWGKVNAVEALKKVDPSYTPPSTTPPTTTVAADAEIRALDGIEAEKTAPAFALADAGDPSARVLPREELRALRDALAAGPRGRALLRLVSEHADEVRRLVTGHRRVAAAWRRAGGPGVVRAVLDAVEDRSLPFPAESGGRPLAAAMEPVLRALRRHGSPALAADVERHAPDLLALSGLSIDHVLERLDAASGG